MSESSVGYFLDGVSDLPRQLDTFRESKYSFIATSVVSRRAKEFKPLCDLLLSSGDWSSCVFGYIHCDELVDEELPEYPLMESQFSYCQHLSLRSIIIECPESFDAITRLGRFLNSKLSNTESCPAIKIFVHLKIQSPLEKSFLWMNGDKSSELTVKPIIQDTWQYFNHLRSHICYEKRLGIALEIDGDLPDREEQKRWFGEPVRLLIIPTSCFMTNRKGYPVLPTPYQTFVQMIIEKTARQIQFLVKGTMEPNRLSYYAQYLDHLKSNLPYTDAVSNFARGYEDFLQIPLQPLADNLESSTYEIFEKDPVKYREYERALICALTNFPAGKRAVILLVGAGRGPLVRCSLKAAALTDRAVHVYAVEKNPNAAVTLRYQDWFEHCPQERDRSSVQVINSDIRDWQAPELADIILSELLGSFADNELSPECLDGVWKCAKPTAISIPSSYRSYLSPVMSHKLYSETVSIRERDKPHYFPLECQYVAFIKNFYEIDSPQQLFEFLHHDLNKNPKERNNKRYGKLTFKAKIDCVCHGFAGYFDTTLYNDIILSTVPVRHSPNMFSWFPIWIPLATPIQVKQGQNIVVHFWRLSNNRQVWYEWCLSEPISTTPQNPNGRSHFIGLS